MSKSKPNDSEQIFVCGKIFIRGEILTGQVPGCLKAMVAYPCSSDFSDRVQVVVVLDEREKLDYGNVRLLDHVNPTQVKIYLKGFASGFVEGRRQVMQDMPSEFDANLMLSQVCQL